jgi:hypothetical protein
MADPDLLTAAHIISRQLVHSKKSLDYLRNFNALSIKIATISCFDLDHYCRMRKHSVSQSDVIDLKLLAELT